MVTNIKNILSNPKWMTICPICKCPTIHIDAHMSCVHPLTKPATGSTIKK